MVTPYEAQQTQNDFIIRSAFDEEFERIFSIWLEGVAHSFNTDNADVAALKRKFRSNFEQRNVVFDYWVAVDEAGRVLGWQSLIPMSNNAFRQNTYAESSTYVSASNRFKGLGKALLAHACNLAAQSHLEYIFGFVAKNNAASLKMTSDLGWTVIGEVPPSKKAFAEQPKLLLVKVLSFDRFNA